MNKAQFLFVLSMLSVVVSALLPIYYPEINMMISDIMINIFKALIFCGVIALIIKLYTSLGDYKHE